jgi:hypothetical protein
MNDLSKNCVVVLRDGRIAIVTEVEGDRIRVAIANTEQTDEVSREHCRLIGFNPVDYDVRRLPVGTKLMKNPDGTYRPAKDGERHVAEIAPSRSIWQIK